jgi:GT2 family glycosyltransferase
LDTPWPIIHVDLETGRATSEEPHRPGAGALLVFWSNDTACGDERLAPSDAIPTTAELLRLGEKFRPHKPKAAPFDSESARQLSVIIPTRDRPDDLQRCLNALAHQAARPGEIVVVDNNPAAHATRKIAERFADVKYVPEAKPGLDRARNAGIVAASGALIAFCDDDVVLHPTWCARMAAAFADQEVQAVTGLVLPLELKTAAQRLFEFEWGFGRGYASIDFWHAKPGSPDAALQPWLVGAGASMAFRRAVFDRLGGFDTRLDAGAAGCSGDSEMWYRILMDGGLCRYTPDVVSFHRHRETLPGLKRQIRAYMRGHVMALLVQQQRRPMKGNLRRALAELPLQYGRRVFRRLRGRSRDEPLLGPEIAGYLEGLWYFVRHLREDDPLPATADPVAA